MWNMMSDETIDGIIFGMQLSSNKQVTQRRTEFNAICAEFRIATKNKTKSEMITELKQHCPAYITELLEKDSENGIRDRYINTFIYRYIKRTL